MEITQRANAVAPTTATIRIHTPAIFRELSTGSLEDGFEAHLLGAAVGSGDASDVMVSILMGAARTKEIIARKNRIAKGGDRIVTFTFTPGHEDRAN